MYESAWLQNVAFYAASQFRLGNMIDAGFTAAVLFEKYIEDELRAHGLSKSNNGDFLCEGIYRLSEINHERYNSDKLHSLRKIRNRSVIHSENLLEYYNDPAARAKNNNKIKELVSFIWERLDNNRYKVYRSIEGIPFHHADNAVIGIQEFFQDNCNHQLNKLTRISESCFTDLIIMRMCLLSLGEYITSQLLCKYNNLEVDLISHVDTSSGYVWLGVNQIMNSPDHLLDRIRYCSASVIATPANLRISINFGRDDYTCRNDYLKFLKTTWVKEMILQHTDLMLLDIEWFSFISLSQVAKDVIGTKIINEQITLAENELHRSKLNNNIMTNERLLLGFVISRSEITFEQISIYLEIIINIYCNFKEFQRVQLLRNDDLT